MKNRMPLEIKFWGVRGSIPTPEAGNLGYGGNTACVEIRYGERLRIVLDAGTGLRRLGHALIREDGRSGQTVHLFFSHFHWDHIHGIPFFPPLYQPAWKLVFHSAVPCAELEAKLGNQMKAPYFAAESAVRAEREYRREGPEGVDIGDVVVRAFPLNHPGGCSGYRIETPYASAVYATDHEHGDPAADKILRAYAEGADILIYDAQYTLQQYPCRQGWGHSTWLEGTRMARDAGVKRLVLFHHDPEHDDHTVSQLLAEARAEFDSTLAAKEDWSVCL